ncbi:YybH family protein [Mesorhizobium silamurunense]|uniref:YybH family protein n=1 Tax=Mesorhizobium silamurunense TaxID=499528 RepID=UPI001781E36E|nr:nuclear transport factor 2 family protein [Mesorhizobium silamurunense]
MSDAASREPARDPQDLERMLIERQWAGDIEGMLALFEPDAVVDSGAGELTRGREAICGLFEKSFATGLKFQRGERRPALVNGNLALTSTKLPDGGITTEVARRQNDGTWLWVIDRYSVT